MVDQGKGPRGKPPLFLDQNNAWRAKKKFFLRSGTPLISASGWLLLTPSPPSPTPIWRCGSATGRIVYKEKIEIRPCIKWLLSRLKSLKTTLIFSNCQPQNKVAYKRWPFTRSSDCKVHRLRKLRFCLREVVAYTHRGLTVFQFSRVPLHSP